jgi:DNA modification methylase
MSDSPLFDSPDSDVRLYCDDCRNVLPMLPDVSIDAVITDPPYPCIKRSYGYWTEEEWFALMKPVVRECRRVLKPHGSAVFILQPNSEKVGRMRPWVWDFLAWCCREWNVVQDHYWWNFTAPPTVHTHRTIGLMRPSVKIGVWLGEPACYRNQDSVLWSQSESNAAADRSDRALKYHPSGSHNRIGRTVAVADERGGVTPFNLLPLANTNSVSSAGSEGHGAGTPEPLCNWWIRYLTRPGDVVLDPFCGSGTTGMAALRLRRKFIGIEAVPEYHAISARRLAEPSMPLWDAVTTAADLQPQSPQQQQQSTLF